jgi:hypothetical protein
LWCKHSVEYNHLPDFFIAFDILDKKTNKFLCQKRVRELLQQHLTVVPLIFEGTIFQLHQRGGLENLDSFIGASKYGKEIAE